MPSTIYCTLSSSALSVETFDIFLHRIRRHDPRSVALGAALADAGEVVSSTLEVSEDTVAKEEEQEQEQKLAAKPQWGKGKGGRRMVRVRRQVEASRRNAASGDANDSSSNRLQWLKNEPQPLDEQKVLARVNREISRCSTMKEALLLVEEMKAAGISSANEGTYVALITVCRRQRQFQRALVVYEAMKTAGVSPGMLTFNTLIGCCQQGLLLEDAFKLKADMESMGLLPDVVTYTSLMSVVAKANPKRGRTSPNQRFARVMELHTEMEKKEVPADAITFNTVLFAALQTKQPEKALEVYGLMSAKGVAPNPFTFGILLEAVGQGGRLKSAMEVFHEMKAAGVAPQTSTYNFLLDACARAPQPDAARAVQLYEEMISSGSGGESAGNSLSVRPNAETYSNLITACAMGGDHKNALKAFAEMKERNLSRGLTVSLYNKLIFSASSHGSIETGFQLYDEMQKAGLKPDVITYGTLVSACANDGDLGRALAVVDEMNSNRVRPNRAVYHALIGAYGAAGQWENAVEIFRNIPVDCEDGKEEDSSPATVAASYTSVIDACFGRAGADAAVAATVAANRTLELTPGVMKALSLYEEGVELGLFKKFSASDICRCDVRNMTRACAIVSVVSWLLRVRALSHPPATDLIVVTGSNKGKPLLGVKMGRYPKLFLCVERTLAAMGLKAKVLRTLTMQALSVDRQQLLQQGDSSTSTHTHTLIESETFPETAAAAAASSELSA